MIPRSTTLIATRLFLAGMLLSVPLAATDTQTEKVIVVLSSESAPYKEALAGFRDSFSQPFTTFNLSKDDPVIPKSTSLLVVIGGKAASYRYINMARDIPLIYCVAPGIHIDREQHAGSVTKVYVSPSPNVLIQKLLTIQPGMRRLGSLWVTDTYMNYGDALKQSSERAGVSVLYEQLKTLDELPDRLRALKGHVDAFWIPPDPLLVTPGSFSIMKQFALDNKMPLYVSIDGLADKGAAASVSVSFREMGRTAGVLASKKLLDSGHQFSAEYGDHVLLTINAGSAAQSGLSLPADVIHKADRVIR